MKLGSGALAAYRAAMWLATPAAPLLLDWRASRGKEDPGRLSERRGRPGLARPEGPLVWTHGASIGETTSLLALVEALVARGLTVLVTSGTVSSAEVLSRRLPAGAIHQYLPLDAPAFASRFLDHWRPSLALFAESELWPNTLGALRDREVPLVLVNARMSARSEARWARAPSVIGALLGRVSLCLAQSDADGARFRRLGALRVAVSGNLKLDLPPPPADPALVEALASRLAGRPVWLAASTHVGEDEAVIAAHRALKARHPGLLTIVAPRHPARGEAIAQAARTAGLEANRRHEGGRPEDTLDIHVADTIGDLGLFYRIVPLVLVGGSLVPHGGQNPIEPARLGCAILHGPHVQNFSDLYAALDEGDGALPLADATRLTDTIAQLIADPARMRDTARRADRIVGRFGGGLARTLAALEPYLPARPSP